MSLGQRERPGEARGGRRSSWLDRCGLDPGGAVLHLASCQRDCAARMPARAASADPSVRGRGSARAP